MKKAFIIFTVLVGMIATNVNAKDNSFYTNSLNVDFTLKEYEFISKMFYEGYQDIMDPSDYEKIFWDKNIVDSKIRTNTFDERLNLVPFAISHETPSKILTIAKACASDCLITINAEWKKSPNVRSYDVIGAYLDNVSLIEKPTTSAVGESELNSSNELVQSNNGFGVSIKLPSSGNSMTVTQYFRVTSGGTVYGSYQHAKSPISLANSKKYTISRSGYGGVFLFNTSVKPSYDSMAGVSISV